MAGWVSKEARQRWEAANPDKMAAQRQRNKRHRLTPEGRKKRNANTMVQKRVARGAYPNVCTFKCVDCNEQATEYHHTDYDLPWLVVPMCKACHKAEHLVPPPP